MESGPQRGERGKECLEIPNPKSQTGPERKTDGGWRKTGGTTTEEESRPRSETEGSEFFIREGQNSLFIRKGHNSLDF